MRRSAIPLLPLMILLLCSTGYAHEQASDPKQGVVAIEGETNDLQEGVRTQEAHDPCGCATERRTWEQFINKLDHRNGDQSL